MKRVMGLVVLGALTCSGIMALERSVYRSCVGEAPATDLVVHEWGTFTALQDEDGNAITGVNSDDEPVPSFVHRYPGSLLSGFASTDMILMKGLPMMHPDVRMRMETPVIYFYPEDPKTMAPIDVKVSFKGGWISEFYPKGDVKSPGVFDLKTKEGHVYQGVGRLDPGKTGSIEWKGITLGAADQIPKTKDEVWLAPREVDASVVKMPSGETEKYIFYRGVGNMESPLRVQTRGTTLKLNVDKGVPITVAWLVDIRRDGSIAWREIDMKTAQTASRFESGDYAPAAESGLKAAMHRALVEDGLYEKEAAAMLKTWDAAYFKSYGTRVFYLLPQSWTDQVLPLELSRDARVVRTMVGRVKLVTPEHHELMKKVSALTVRDLGWQSVGMREAFPEEKALKAAYKKIQEGKATYADYGVYPPESYAAFRDLGRFRGPMLAHYNKDLKIKPMMQQLLSLQPMRLHNPPAK